MVKKAKLDPETGISKKSLDYFDFSLKPSRVEMEQSFSSDPFIPNMGLGGVPFDCIGRHYRHEEEHERKKISFWGLMIIRK